MSNSVVCVFDVDGTLTPARKCILQEVEQMLQKLKTVTKVAIVSGSDISKIIEQMGQVDVLNFMDYVFAENGLVAYKDGKLLSEMSMVKLLGEELVQKVINFCLNYMSQLTLPVKRGTFIEFRTSMLNVSPIGRSCTYDERLQFNKYDQEHGIRANFVKELEKEFSDCGLDIAIGGQISIDIYPKGWDKRYCLKFLESEFDEIHFFGDKTMKGGNDFAIYEDKRTIGHTVTNPDDTIQTVTKLFLENI